MARKFIILDFAATEATKLAALGFAVLVLGAVYWLLQERDDHAEAHSGGAQSAAAPGVSEECK